MSNTMQSKIQSLASQFASGVIDIMLGSSLEEITGGKSSTSMVASSKASSSTKSPGKTKKSKTGRLARRSEEDIAEVVGKIVGLLKSKPEGLRAEQIRDELGLDVREMPRPLADALASKQLTKKGDKRATTYFAGTAKKAFAKAKPAKGATKAKPAKAKAKPATKKATTAKKVATKAKAKSTKKAPAAKAKSTKKVPEGGGVAPLEFIGGDE